MYKRILLAVDDSDAAQRALAEAVRVGKASDAEVKCLCAVTTFYDHGLASASEADIPIATSEEALVSGKRVLAHAQTKLGDSGVKYSTQLNELSSASEKIADTIVNEANDWNADLIIMGTHGRRGIKRMVLGSVSEGVVAQANMPVLLVRSHFEE